MKEKPLSVADHKSQYSKILKENSDLEIVEAFNGQVGNPGWGAARQGYLWALKEELIVRKIDISEVGDESGMSYKRKVKLIDKKLILID